MYPCVVSNSSPEAAVGPEVFGGRLRHGRGASLESLAARVREMLGGEWLPRVYQERVRPLRTRSFKLPTAARDSRVSVQHTLLGVELQIGRRRLSCPDLATARYLSAFARAGCDEVAVPYDITKISRLADDLESSWQRAMLLAEHLTEGRAKGFRTRLKKALAAEMRDEIAQAGAGTATPQFKQDTKQRLYREPRRRAGGA
jgi:hypothetical protein